MASSESSLCNWIAMEREVKYGQHLGENMGLGYDIFRESSDGPLWVTQAATLTEAKEKLEALVCSVPGKYFVRDAASAKVVGRMGADTSGEVER